MVGLLLGTELIFDALLLWSTLILAEGTSSVGPPPEIMNGSAMPTGGGAPVAL